MSDKRTSLIEALEELIPLLRDHGDTHWAAWLESDLIRIQARDIEGVSHLLSAFGGMGSFNDVILDQRSSGLRSQAWCLARDLSREALLE